MSLILSNWPLLFVCLAMVVAAVIDGWKLKVPNWLTLPLIVTGWILGLVHTCGFLTPSTGEGGILGSLAGTLVGLALLLPIYAIGGMGAGDVKMQMGFGAWIGAFFSVSVALWTIVWAFCLATVIGGIMAVVMIFMRAQFSRNMSNTREILSDLMSATGVSEVADKAAKRKPRMHLLPYGIPLCLGFLGYLWWAAPQLDASLQHAAPDVQQQVTQ